VAREAAVKMLALVHISSRYHVGTVLDEAREVFEPSLAPRDFDVIEVPFPERGGPRLVPNGARDSGNGLNDDKLAGEDPAEGQDSVGGASGVPPHGTAE
jgi:ribonuclease Z